MHQELGTIWCTKQLRQMKWSSSENPLNVLNRLVTNIAKFIYWSTFDTRDVSDFLPGPVIEQHKGETRLGVDIMTTARRVMDKQQNQLRNGAKSGLKSLGTRGPRQGSTKEERMTIWENAFGHKDPTVQGLFAHFLSAIDLMEIMNQEEDWPTKVWAKKLYINLMDLQWLEVYQSVTLTQEVKKRIRLN
jgi:hypothetical protein